MDPITAIANAVTAALTLGTKVWDAMPADQKTAGAGDWGKITHNAAQLLINLGDKINAAVKP